MSPKMYKGRHVRLEDGTGGLVFSADQVDEVVFLTVETAGGGMVRVEIEHAEVITPNG